MIGSSASSAKTRLKLRASGVIPPLVTMLLSPNPDARQASLLALLNLAVRNDRNNVKIVTAGAVPPLVELLKFQNGSLRDLSSAAILTLSTAALNKPIIAASGAAPLLVQILSSGSFQGKVDAMTSLYNLSTCKDNTTAILDATAVWRWTPRKIEKRVQDRTLDSYIEEQFGGDRLLACISSRPGQSSEEEGEGCCGHCLSLIFFTIL